MPQSTDNLFAVWAKWRSIPCWLRHLHMLGYSQESLDALEVIDDQFYLFADTEERAWRESQRSELPRVEHEWLKIFPEATAVINDKIREWQKYEAELIATIRHKLKTPTASKLGDLICREWIKLNEANDVGIARAHIRRLQYLRAPASQSGWISPADIDAAKAVPIQTMLADREFRQSGKNLKALCPFHHERTASFYVYPGTNTFHCFGCDKSGDAIELTKLIHGCNFADAVRRLIPKVGNQQ